MVERTFLQCFVLKSYPVGSALVLTSAPKSRHARARNALPRKLCEAQGWPRVRSGRHGGAVAVLLADAGALYRVYPEPYSVWREDSEQEGGYMLSYSGVRRPSGDELDDLLFPDDGDDGEGSGNPLAGLQSFIKGFQAM